MKKIEIYKPVGNEKQIDVTFNNDSVWLTQNQISELFERDRTVISKHISNVFKEGELVEKVVCANFAHTTLHGAIKDKTQETTVKCYNLDVIISVGYRVKSKQGTNFRIWATNILKKQLINSIKKAPSALNYEDKYLQLIKTITVATNTANNYELNASEATGILKILNEYAYALKTLDKYDHQQLTISETRHQDVKELNYQDAKKLIEEWQIIQNTGELFGREKDQSFKSSLQSIYQTVGGEDVYPSIEEKAANLLYFIVKNHSFSDGNKRIAAGLFVYFLDMNNSLYKQDGSKIIGDNDFGSHNNYDS